MRGRSTLVAMAALALAASVMPGVAVAQTPQTSKRRGRRQPASYSPEEVRRLRTDNSLEIAQWNAKVQAKRDAKLARKAKR